MLLREKGDLNQIIVKYFSPHGFYVFTFICQTEKPQMTKHILTSGKFNFVMMCCLAGPRHRLPLLKILIKKQRNIQSWKQMQDAETQEMAWKKYQGIKTDNPARNKGKLWSLRLKQKQKSRRTTRMQSLEQNPTFFLFYFIFINILADYCCNAARKS